MTQTTASTVANFVAASETWRDNKIAQVIAEWTQETFAEWNGAVYDLDTPVSEKDILRHLESIDCAACHAPAGLIYSAEIAAKVPEWARDIDDALGNFEDLMGDPWHGGKHGVSIDRLVWFAVEWTAGRIADDLRIGWEVED